MPDVVEVYYGLPKEVKFCKKCVMSNQRPSSVVEFLHRPTDQKPTIVFDEEGVCGACRHAERKESIDWAQRELELQQLCNRYRSKNGSYDCIVPGSGGKDSGFVSHLLKNKYNMNPLTVTWAPHIYTDIGWKNFQNWIHSGFDNILCTPNGKVHRLLTKLAFENLCHPFQPFIIGQKMVASRFSALYGIPLIIYGENPVEYGDNLADPNSPTMKPIFYESKPSVDTLVLGGVSAKELIENYNVSINDLNPYLPVDGERLKALGTQVHYISYYHKWDPQENYYYVSEHTGFAANTERTEGSYCKYSSIDDATDPFHYFTTLVKFGIGRTTYDAAQEIRNGKITREEAVALVKKFDTEFPKKYFKAFLEYMDISEERFWEVIDNARSPHLWQKSAGIWHLRLQVE